MQKRVILRSLSGLKVSIKESIPKFVMHFENAILFCHIFLQQFFCSKLHSTIPTLSYTYICRYTAEKFGWSSSKRFEWRLVKGILDQKSTGQAFETFFPAKFRYLENCKQFKYVDSFYALWNLYCSIFLAVFFFFSNFGFRPL